MSAVKDILDLTIKLLESKDARKFAAEIAKIQILTATVQSEQAAIVEKYTESQLKILSLAKRIAELEATERDLKMRIVELEAEQRQTKPDPGFEGMIGGG